MSLEQTHTAQKVVISCVEGDEEQWAVRPEETYGMVPLDMAAGRQQYPELYL